MISLAGHRPDVTTGLVLPLESPGLALVIDHPLSQPPKAQKDKRVKWTLELHAYVLSFFSSASGSGSWEAKKLPNNIRSRTTFFKGLCKILSDVCKCPAKIDLKRPS